MPVPKPCLAHDHERGHHRLAAAGGATPRVVLLLVRHTRLPGLLSLLQRVAPHATVLVANNHTEATTQLALGGIDLLALDLQLACDQPLALIHLLARFAPSTALMAFAETGMQPSIQPYGLRSWDEAEAALLRATHAGGPLEASRLPLKP